MSELKAFEVFRDFWDTDDVTGVREWVGSTRNLAERVEGTHFIFDWDRNWRARMRFE